MSFESLEHRTLLASVPALVETTPVPHSGDAADDPAIWVNQANPALSTIIGTDKDGGIAVYDLTGRQLQYRADGRINNVDLRYNVAGYGTVVAASNRSNNSIELYRVNPSTRLLENVAARTVTAGFDVYGLCMYQSPVSGKTFVFVSSEDDGDIEQWELFASGGEVDARRVRAWDVGGVCEGIVADDEAGKVYIGEEDHAVRIYNAEPNGGTSRTTLDRVSSAGGRLHADIEGVSIYYRSGGRGYILVSDQSQDDFMVYDRQTGAFRGEFTIVGGSADGVTHTDGIDIENLSMGPVFPNGVFVAQDDGNGSGRQNFKLVPNERIFNVLGLTLDNTYGGNQPAPIPVPVLVPTAPTNFEAHDTSPTTVHMSWDDNASNELGYKVYRKIGDGTWMRLATLAANVESYDDTGLTPKTSYTYRVRAYNSAGNSAYSNSDGTRTEAVTAPLASTAASHTVSWQSLDARNDVQTVFELLDGLIQGVSHG